MTPRGQSPIGVGFRTDSAPLGPWHPYHRHRWSENGSDTTRYGASWASRGALSLDEALDRAPRPGVRTSASGSFFRDSPQASPAGTARFTDPRQPPRARRVLNRDAPRPAGRAIWVGCP